MTAAAPRRAFPSAHPPAVPTEPDSEPAGSALFPGDIGELPMLGRRVLVQLIKGPYVSAALHPQLWPALLNDQTAIQQRLNDLFLRLVIDADAGLAFVAGVDAADPGLPKVIRATPLTLLDTALVLFLRERLLRADTAGGRVIVGRDEINDQLRAYRPVTATDAVTFEKRINACVEKLKANSVLLRTAEDDRFEISPILALVFRTDEVHAVAAQLRRLLDHPDEDPASDASDASDTEELP